MRIPFHTVILCLFFILGTTSSLGETSGHPTDKHHFGKGVRQLLPDPGVDSKQWLFFTFRGAVGQKSVVNTFHSHGPAVRIDIEKPGPEPWTIQFCQLVPYALSKAEVLRLHFWARSSTNNTLSTFFGHKNTPYEPFLGASLVLTPNWKEYSVIIKLPRDIPENWATLNLLLAFAPGTVELADISLEDWGANPTTMPQAKNMYSRMFLDSGDTHRFFQDANRRIEAIRKGGLTVRVVDSTGSPVKNASVSVQQLRHKFRFGTGISPCALFDTGEDGKKYRETVLKLFNCAVIDNALKWEAQDYCSPDTADRMLSWCEANHLPVRGHNLLWPNFTLLPNSVRDLRGDQLRDAIHRHITEYASRYRGRVYVWDVINEALDNHDVQDNLGQGILVDAFKWTREADPKVDLAYSEYNIINNNGGANDHCRKAAIDLVDYLLKNNAPINAIADQGHMTIPLTHGEQIVSILDGWARFKMPVEITEYELAVSDDKIHAAYLREFLTAVFSHPSVQSFYVLVFWDGSQWLTDEGRAMFRRDWTPRPTVDVYKDLVFHQWWTSARAKSNADGDAKFRVFLGDHEVTVRKGDRVSSAKVSVEENQDAMKTITVVLPEQ